MVWVVVCVCVCVCVCVSYVQGVCGGGELSHVSSQDVKVEGGREQPSASGPLLPVA